MRHLLIASLFILFLAGSSISQNYPTGNEPTLAEPDSTVDIVGYFAKNDTLVYWIDQTRWQLTPTDTIKIAGVSTKVRLTVADSTETGYKIDYTFLEVQPDSITNSDVASLLTQLTANIAKQTVGTTITFETDELGTITRFNNLEQIRQQAETLFNDVVTTMMQSDILSELAAQGIDLSRISEIFDSDQLVDGYLEEIKLLFLFHGLSYKEGQSHTHKDATESAYENDTYITAVNDSESGTYSIIVEVNNIIPPTELKSVAGQLIGKVTDGSGAESISEAFDSQIVDNCIYTSYFISNYLSCGWPYNVINQTTITLNDRGKTTQTHIYLDTIN